MTLLGFYNVPNFRYLVARESEIPSTGFMSLLRYIKRLNDDKIIYVFKTGAANILTREIINLSSGEKLINKTKLFFNLAKLYQNNPFSHNHFKLVELLKDIRSQAENYDQGCISNIAEGLIYFEDSTKNETLKELLEIITMTIKHRPENIRLNFIYSILSSFGQYRNESAMNTEHLNTIIEFLLNSFSTLDPVAIYPRFFDIWTAIYRLKYNDKDVIEKLFNYTLPLGHAFNVSDSASAKNFKFVVRNTLGEEYLDKFREVTNKKLLANLKDGDKPVSFSFQTLSKSAFFANNAKPSTPEEEEILKITLENIEKQKDRIGYFSVIVEHYVKNTQYHLNINQRLAIVEKLLNLNPPEQYATVNNSFKLFIYINQLQFPRNKEELVIKLKEISQAICTNPIFKKNYANHFINLCQVSHSSKISNQGIIRYVIQLREFIKNEEFIQENPRILEKLLLSATYLIYHMKEKEKIYTDLGSESISSLIQIADQIAEQNPTLVINMPWQKLATITKLFNSLNINSNVINKSVIEHLKTIDAERNLNNDLIVLLEKLIKWNGVNKEDRLEIFRRWFPEQETILNKYISGSNVTKQPLFRIFATANKFDDRIVNDETMNKLKKELVEKIKSSELGDVGKIHSIASLCYIKYDILNKAEELKEYNTLIKSVFTGIHSKRIYKLIDNIPRPQDRKSLSYIVYNNFLQNFEKENDIDKFYFLKVLDKTTTIKWKALSFYNKIISDYERLFDKFQTIDHCLLINYFARVNLDKEDVIRAATKNITIGALDEREKFNLFNSFIRLGFTSPEWREEFLSKLIQDQDFRNYIKNKLNFRVSISSLVNLWILGDWPKDNEQIVLYIFNLGRSYRQQIKQL